jgi:hypothetical protein
VLDLRPFVDGALRVLGSHELAPGAYRRFHAHPLDPDRDLGVNPYGCADAANILYTIGHFPRSADTRRTFVERLRDLQDPETGLFREATHHEIHTTAHCVAALELFDAAPRHPLGALAPLAEPAALEDFLERLDWRGEPWTESHRGAGLYAALALAGGLGAAGEERYFAWLARETDPASGFLRRGCVERSAGASLFPHLAGTFHYLFNFEWARRPLPHAEARIDTCLEIAERKLFPFARFLGFAEVDWVYCLTRSLRQCGHRFQDCRVALSRFAEAYASFLLGLDADTHDGMNDLHSLFGALCCLAELQQSLPGTIRTERPLRLVLDRRPFI